MKEIYFETIKCDDYEVFNLPYHKNRIARTIGKNIDLQEYIYPPSEDLLKCKLIYNQDEIIDIQYSPYIPKNQKKFKIIYDDDIEYKYKMVNRETIDNLYNMKDDCDEIIIVKNGFLTDTSIANIALFQDERWLTPTQPLLEGTIRAKMLEEGILKEMNLSIEDLKNSEKIALMNAMIGFKVIEDYKIIY